MAESTMAYKSTKEMLTSTVCISSCSPFRKLSFLFSLVSVSSGAYRDKVRNLSWYSTTDILPCLSSLNSSLIFLIKPGGTWYLLNLSLNSSQVIIFPSIHGTGTVPPCSGRSRQIVGGQQ